MYNHSQFAIIIIIIMHLVIFTIYNIIGTILSSTYKNV